MKDEIGDKLEKKKNSNERKKFYISLMYAPMKQINYWNTKLTKT